MADEQQDDPKQNPAHLANFPRGHKRDEENRRRTDALAEELEKDNEAGGINAKALKKEREILQRFDPVTGDLTVTDARSDRHYVWVNKHPIKIREYQRLGYQMVGGEDKEALEYKGLDCATGTSLRGCADVYLMYIPTDMRQQWEERQILQSIATGAIGLDEGPESAWADEANGPRSPSARVGARAYGRRSDPKMQSTIFRGTAGQIQKLNDGIRSGNIPNFENNMRGR